MPEKERSESRRPAQVVTVDEFGSAIGLADLEAAHLDPGVLHLAVSVQLVDEDELWILQRRSASKLLFPLRWANSCCTHPKPNEPLIEAASRRLYEELGLRVSYLEPKGSFLYNAYDAASGMVEYEMDHVYVGRAVGAPKPSAAEVDQLAHVCLDEAKVLLSAQDAAPWARSVLDLAAGQGRSHAVP